MQDVSVYLRDGSAQRIVRAATLRQKLQIKLSISSSQYTDTEPTIPSADPITPGWVATGHQLLSHWYIST